MTWLKTFLLLCILFARINASRWHHQKREITNICEQTGDSKLQCKCMKTYSGDIHNVDCFLEISDINIDDPIWETFDVLNNITKLTFSNLRRVPLKYIPTIALKHTTKLSKLEIKYGSIDVIQPFAFANMSTITELSLRDNQIATLQEHGFCHLKKLQKISLDLNRISEINRNVFSDLPELIRLYLSNNNITTLHDRAFVELHNLKELELNKNAIFSLNSETFSGLKSLYKLDLSNNVLEVIGDNTFHQLHNLVILNLEANNIQVLDEKAFAGLENLQSLSLALNKLVKIDNVKVFQGLSSLQKLNLKGNNLIELESNVIAPIMNNFYGISGDLIVEDNKFPCSCKLEWFTTLMNNTQNTILKNKLDNLRCIPDANLKELWAKQEETEKNNGQTFEDGVPSQGNEYEYYDDATELNGMLFYTDVREMINCTSPKPKLHIEAPIKDTKAKPSDIDNTPVMSMHNKNQQPITTTEYHTISTTERHRPQYNPPVVTNHGLLDLSATEEPEKPANVKKNNNELVDINEIVAKSGDKSETSTDKKPSSYTTSRLVTVSAKPVEKGQFYDDNSMASDEARPEIKAHRSVQDLKLSADSPKHNNAYKNSGYGPMFVLLILCLF